MAILVFKMRKAVLILSMLLLALCGIARAGDNTFWRTLDALAKDPHGDDLKSFLGTGMLPSGSSATQHAGSVAAAQSVDHINPQSAVPQSAGPPLHPVTLQTHGSTRSLLPASSASSLEPLPNALSRETLPYVHLDSANQVVPPPPLSVPERQAILAEAVGLLNLRRRAQSETPTYPFMGTELTAGLLQEAIARKVYFQEYKPGYYALLGKRSGKETPYYTRTQGGMKPSQTSQYHLYIWRRFQVPGYSYSVFQLVGMLESSHMQANRVVAHLKAYSTGRSFRTLGPDSVFDASSFKHVKN